MDGPEIIRKTDLAALMGVSRARVSALLRRGLPQREDGLINRRAALRWWDANVASPERRRGRESRRLAEGEVVVRQEVQQIMFDVGRETREKLMRIPGEVSEQIAKTDNAEEIRGLLKEKIREALRELADEFGDDLSS